ncbi:MAG: YkgJ family cysteine cluster protein [Bacteroidia bacterium]
MITLEETYKTIKKSLKKKLTKLKKNPPSNLDKSFQDWHDKAFQNINCLTCANCCKTTSPMVFEKDVDRLSQYLGIKPGELIDKYLFLDRDGTYAMRQTPCPFLGDDNYCLVYEGRPKACREFPHLNHRKMHTHLHLLDKNAVICPAVLETVKKIIETT